MSSFYHILKKPLVTERATQLKAAANQYTFRVASNSSKGDIKRAIQGLFNVKVLRVRTMNVHGKFRRMGNAPGSHRSDWKKAIVTLPAGQEIKALEDAS